jgi:probable selenium-dependent hydroxylase accessory protein YqeC
MTPLTEALELKNGGVVSLVGAGGKTSLMFRLAAELAAAARRVITTTTTKILYPDEKQCRHVLLDPDPRSLLQQATAGIAKHHHLTLAHPRLAQHPEKLAGLSPGLVDDLWATGCFDCILVEADGAAGRPLKAPASREPVICSSTTRVVGILGVRAAGKPLTDQWVFRKEHFSRITGLEAGDLIDETAMARAILSGRGIFKNAPAGSGKMAFLNLAGDPALLKSAREIVRQLKQNRRCARLTRVVIGNGLDMPAVLEYHDLNAGD